MQVSELIVRLTEILRDHGDIEVEVNRGGYASHINEVTVNPVNQVFDGEIGPEGRRIYENDKLEAIINHG